jgi:hypothetical protein
MLRFARIVGKFYHYNLAISGKLASWLISERRSIMADDPPIADESGFQTQENSYWQFSVAFYARQNIQELLLKAQNRHALDINMLLYALWQAAEGHSLSFGDFVKLNETIADWRKTILLPMRDLRRL